MGHVCPYLCISMLVYWQAKTRKLGRPGVASPVDELGLWLAKWFPNGWDGLPKAPWLRQCHVLMLKPFSQNTNAFHRDSDLLSSSRSSAHPGHPRKGELQGQDLEKFQLMGAVSLSLFPPPRVQWLVWVSFFICFDVPRKLDITAKNNCPNWLSHEKWPHSGWRIQVSHGFSGLSRQYLTNKPVSCVC